MFRGHFVASAHNIWNLDHILQAGFFPARPRDILAGISSRFYYNRKFRAAISQNFTYSISVKSDWKGFAVFYLNFTIMVLELLLSLILCVWMQGLHSEKDMTAISYCFLINIPVSVWSALINDVSHFELWTLL